MQHQNFKLTQKKYKLVLITTGQPSVNPRIVKEANAFTTAGHNVTMVYCNWISWADKADLTILKNANWKGILVGGSSRKNILLFYYTKLRYKFFRFLSSKNICNLSVAENAQARCYPELLALATSLKGDYYIAHNLGALAVAKKAAIANTSKCGFDFEDYHRGEVELMNNADKKRINYLEEKYIPGCDHLSFASPMIAAKELMHFPNFRNNSIVINNCFPLNDIPPIHGINGKLNLFWFSQTVGADRGLITVLLAMKLLNNSKIALTLVGNITDEILKDFKNILGDLSKQLIIKGIVPPQDIDKIAAEADVGLALEQSIPINRDICLTNKIFTYLSSGLAIIFTDTTAQKEFNYTYRAGLIYEQGNVEALASCLQEYLKPGKLYQQKLNNWQLAKEKLNWEEESKKLLDLIE